jgi:fructokinase
MTQSVWVLGEALMDCVAQTDGSLRPLIGGSPFNLACAVALQQVDVGYLNPFSTDVFGQQLTARLASTGAKALSKPSPKVCCSAIFTDRPSTVGHQYGVCHRKSVLA